MTHIRAHPVGMRLGVSVFWQPNGIQYLFSVPLLRQCVAIAQWLGSWFFTQQIYLASLDIVDVKADKLFVALEYVALPRFLLKTRRRKFVRDRQRVKIRKPKHPKVTPWLLKISTLKQKTLRKESRKKKIWYAKDAPRPRVHFKRRLMKSYKIKKQFCLQSLGSRAELFFFSTLRKWSSRRQFSRFRLSPLAPNWYSSLTMEDLFHRSTRRLYTHVTTRWFAVKGSYHLAGYWPKWQQRRKIVRLRIRSAIGAKAGSKIPDIFVTSNRRKRIFRPLYRNVGLRTFSRGRRKKKRHKRFRFFLRMRLRFFLMRRSFKFKHIRRFLLLAKKKKKNVSFPLFSRFIKMFLTGVRMRTRRSFRFWRFRQVRAMKRTLMPQKFYLDQLRFIWSLKATFDRYLKVPCFLHCVNLFQAFFQISMIPFLTLRQTTKRRLYVLAIKKKRAASLRYLRRLYLRKGLSPHNFALFSASGYNRFTFFQVLLFLGLHPTWRKMANMYVLCHLIIIAAILRNTQVIAQWLYSTIYNCHTRRLRSMRMRFFGVVAKLLRDFAVLARFLKGFRIEVRGKVGRSQKTAVRYFGDEKGLQQHNLKFKSNYQTFEIPTYAGILGVRMWLF